MPKSRETVSVIVVLGFLISLTANLFVSGQEAVVSTIHDAHFSVQETLGAFTGEKLLCSFNATSNQWIELKITSTSESRYPDSAHEAIFRLTSNQHGAIITLRTYDSLNQTINLTYDDTYNITVAKHPMFANVYVGATIDLYHDEMSNSTSSITPTSTPTPFATKVSYPFISGINISEPKNTTYLSEENLTLEVNFTAWVHYNINYFVTYILDGENNSIIIPYEYITNDSWDLDPHVGIIKGSVALPKLSEGIHNITVIAQAQGSATTSSSGFVTFAVNTHSSPIPSPTIEPSLVSTINQPIDSLGSLNQIIPAAIVAAIVIAAAITSLIIFKRREQLTSKQSFL